MIRALNRRQALTGNATGSSPSALTLVLDPWQLGEPNVILLSSIQVLNISRIPVDAASTTTLATSTWCVLVHVVGFTGAVSIVVG